MSSLSLAGAATSIKYVFVATKHVFCRDKNMFAPTKRLSPQNYVATDICRDKFLWQQAYFSRTKKDAFCRYKQVFVATKVKLVATKHLWRKLVFVETKDVLCRDKHELSPQTRVCGDTTLVATKMILVAAPANDTSRGRTSGVIVYRGSLLDTGLLRMTSPGNNNKKHSLNIGLRRK